MVIRPKIAPARGVLHSETADPGRSHHARYHPSPDLEPYVEHYWSVRWNYGGLAPERVEILPHPSVHMTFDSQGARITGVTRGKFSRILSDRGSVFGVKFTPGGFYPFLRAPVSSITDASASLHDLFGDDGDALARAMQAKRTDARRITLVEAFLRSRKPEPDDNVGRISELVYTVANDRSILKVEDLAARGGVTRRAVQRLFAKYVGVSPKWVIQRYRLHEAAEQLSAGGAIKQSALASSLGYSDQAHFIRDFKAVVGSSPAEYAKRSVRARHVAAQKCRGAPPSLKQVVAGYIEAGAQTYLRQPQEHVLIASIEEPAVIARILAHWERTAPEQHPAELPLAARAPPARSRLR